MSIAPLLTDLRVIDLAGEAGVFATRLLADLGADVIRIEPPGGDGVRQRRPFLNGNPGQERSLYHQHFNRNKRSVVLDLATEAGRADFLRLAASADVVVETARPGEMDALGLGREALAATNPGLVYATLTPFGQEGPFRHYQGNDLIAAAASGFLYLNGFPDGPPETPAAEQAYKMGSLATAIGILMAVVARDGDPEARARRVDVSLQEAASMATVQTANANIYAWHGRVPRRSGNISGVHRCMDGKWVSFVLRTGVQETWSDLVDWLKEEQIETPVTEDEWRDQSVSIERRGAVTEAIAKLCAKHERSYIFHEGQRRKQLVMPVNDVADLLADEQLRHRGFFIQVPQPVLGQDLTDSGPPYRFSGVAPRPARPAPALGQHTAEVLAFLPAASGRPPNPPKKPPPFDPTRPLAGVRVADFSWLIAGPAVSRVLADYGAEVVKIESQYRLDNIRVVGVQPPGTGGGSIDTNGVFNDCNTNKLSVRLNLNLPAGQRLAREIVAKSDIVLNNFTADRMPRWGLGYDDLRAVKPDIVMLSMPVMGGTGPYRNYGSYGNGVVAYGGLNMAMGFPDRPPVGLGPLYSDFSAPYFVVIALMAALHHRNRTGEGQFIDFSQAEATVALLGEKVLEYSANGTLPKRQGNRADDFAPHGVYRCLGEDRWCAIAVATDEEWRALARAMGQPGLADDPRFASFEARKANEDALDALVSAWTVERDAWQAMHALQGGGIMAAVVEDLEDVVVRDPWMSKRHLVDVTQEESGVVFKTHNQPVRLEGRVPPLRRAPLMGEHTEDVLRRILGLDQDEIERLIIDEVLY